MKICFLFTILSLTVICCSQKESSNNSENSVLWPEIEPYETDYLKVSNLHEIYYELSGNPDGKPVFVLHGGPGGSTSPYMRRFFNPEKFLIVMHDQRGAGKSKPFAETKQNTTQLLVEDIETLRNHLDIGKIILFGGSWGSTLALAYAEEFPENVYGLVLRGIFTATKAEIDHFYHGGIRKYFPEVYYEQFLGSLENPDTGNMPAHLLHIFQQGDSAMIKKYAKVWAAYEIKISGLDISDAELESILKNFNPLAFGVLENYYMAHNCFLEENQLINNIHKLKGIPTIMVNGRYDMICPPITAYLIHKKFPESKMIVAEKNGHWMGEKPLEKELVKAMYEFE
ncbi:prolyl aminopeptidase [Bacteroidota bacterium]